MCGGDVLSKFSLVATKEKRRHNISGPGRHPRNLTRNRPDCDRRPELELVARAAAEGIKEGRSVSVTGRP